MSTPSLRDVIGLPDEAACRRLVALLGAQPQEQPTDQHESEEVQI